MRAYKVTLDDDKLCQCGEPAIVQLVMGPITGGQDEFSCTECWEDTKETVDEEIAEAMKES